MNTPDVNGGTYSHAWTIAWAVFVFGGFGIFLAMELTALATNWRNTLSAQIWRMIAFRQGQPVPQWSWDHFLFAGMFAVVGIWMFFHFNLGWWKS